MTTRKQPVVQETKRQRFRWFLQILLVFAVMIAVFLVYIALLPPDFRVARSTTIKAAPADVFASVNDFHAWNDWSPWIKLDPKAKVDFTGPDAGVGAKFHWAGNAEVGEGSMTITESKPSEEIAIRLDFTKPFEDTANVFFHLKPEGDGTNVTWEMKGKSNFVGRLFCFFMNMDKMIGEKYAEGLASLKKVVEEKKKSES